jgi:hypothetical protein
MSFLGENMSVSYPVMYARGSKMLGFFLLLILAASNAVDAKSLDGMALRAVLMEDLTLDVQAEPYLLKQDVLVPAGHLLEINPGVSLHFLPGVSLIIEGELQALGTKRSPIRFAAADTLNPWGNVRIIGNKDLPCYDGDYEYIPDSGGSRLQHCVFTNGGTVPDVDYGGGALYLDGSAPIISQCEFMGNQAERGGALVIYNFSTPLVDACTFHGNKSLVDGGGAIFCFFYSDAVIRNNFFVKNESARQGGAIYLSNSDPVIESNAMIDNTAQGMGGAAFISSSSPVFKDNAIYENRGANRAHGVVLQADCRPLIRGNSLLSGGVDITGLNLTQDIDASENWWGTRVEDDIEERVSQRGRRANHRIEIEPWREEPIANLLTQPVEIYSLHVMTNSAYDDTLAFDLVDGHRARVQIQAKDRNPYAVDQTSLRVSVLERPEVSLILSLKETEKASGLFRARFSVGDGDGSLPILPVAIGEHVLLVSSADDRVKRLFLVDEVRPVVHELAIVSDHDPTHLIQHNLQVAWKFFDLSGASQSHWQVQVAGKNNFSSQLVWDSGLKPASAGLRQAEYSGQTLQDGEHYFFRLRVQAGSNWSAWKTFMVRSDQPGYSFRLNSLPDVPTILEPQPEEILASHRPALQIGEAVDREGDRVGVHMQIAEDEYFQTIVAESDPESLSEFKWQPEMDLRDNASLFARARFHDGFEWSGWSSVRPFFLNPIEQAPLAFDLYDPSGVSADVRPSFTWAASSDLDPGSKLSYDLLLSGSGDFSSARRVRLEEMRWRPEEELANKVDLFWTVEAVDQTGLRRRAERVLKVHVNTTPSVPVALFPQGEEEIKAHQTFSIRPSVDPWPSDVLLYELQLTADGNFSKPLAWWRGLSLEDLSATGIDAYKDAVNLLSDDRRYFWRCRAIDNHKAASEWSKVSAFFFNRRNDAPVLASSGRSPLEASVLRQGPVLTWSEATDGDLSDTPASLTMTIQLSQAADFSQGLIERRVQGDLSLSLEGLLDDNTHWFWRMLVEDDEGARSDFSEVYSFELNHVEEEPGGFAILSPAGNSWYAIDQISFDWSESIDPDWQDPIMYTWVLSGDQGFSELIASGRQSGREVTINKPLSSRSTVYFRVKAVDEGGLETTAPIRAIDVDSHPSLPVPMEAGMERGPEDAFEWAAAIDPDPNDKILYRVTILDDKDRRVVDVKGIPGRRVTIGRLYGADKLPEDAPLSWMVKATDPHGLEATSDPIPFWYSRQNDAPTAPRLTPLKSEFVTEIPLSLSFEPGSDPDYSDTPNSLHHEVEITRQGASSAARTFDIAAGLQETSALDLGDNAEWSIRLRTVDARGLSSPYTKALNVVVNTKPEAPEAPKWLQQTDGLKLVDLTGFDFRFSAATDPDPRAILHYELEVLDKSGSTLKRSPTKVPGGRLDFAFENATSYRLRLWAIDETGLSTPSIPLPIFIDTAPGPVNFRTQGGLELEDGDVITWTEGQDPDPKDRLVYELDFATRADFVSSRRMEQAKTSLRARNLNMEDGLHYFLRVRAKDDQGIVGPWSPALTFMKKPPPPPPVEPDSLNVDPAGLQTN